MRSNEKGQQVSSRAFRCGYKGCGRLYTTAHHLKVKQVTCGHAVCRPGISPCYSARMLLYKRLSCELGSLRDPGVLTGQGEIQQTTSDSLHQLDFSTLLSFLLVLYVILGTCSFFPGT